MEDSSVTTGYWINLGNGLAWSLMATKDTDAWLREFSSILEMVTMETTASPRERRNQAENPRVIRVRMETLGRSLRACWALAAKAARSGRDS